MVVKEKVAEVMVLVEEREVLEVTVLVKGGEEVEDCSGDNGAYEMAVKEKVVEVVVLVEVGERTVGGDGASEGGRGSGLRLWRRILCWY